MTSPLSLLDLARAYVFRAALVATAGNVSAASRRVGLSRRHFYVELHRLGLLAWNSEAHPNAGRQGAQADKARAARAAKPTAKRVPRQAKKTGR